MDQGRILMGVIGRPHGVRGLLHVVAYAGDLGAFDSFADDAGRTLALRPRRGGVFEVSVLEGDVRTPVTDRDAAARLTNTRLYVDRAQLPPADPDEFYLADLVGMAVLDAAGVPVGAVSVVHDYGAGASLEIARDDAPPLLVPFTRLAVPDIDVAARRLTVVPPVEAAAP